MLRKIFLALIVFSTFPTLVYAEDMNSPVGTWQTISDKTNKPSSIVKISSEKNTLVGQVMQLLPGSHYKATDLCTRCPDTLKNQPIVGLKFLWDFEADEKGTWKNGKVLDPNDGNIYRGTLKLTENGKKMEIRGFWGPFWRTQTWIRA